MSPAATPATLTTCFPPRRNIVLKPLINKLQRTLKRLRQTNTNDNQHRRQYLKKPKLAHKATPLDKKVKQKQSKAVPPIIQLFAKNREFTRV
jgi:hypothetical protein